MAQTKRYAMKFRRRREGKTNYKKRLALLQSRKARLVVRKTNSDTVVQIVEYAPDGDIIKASASARQLGKLGWKGSTGNLPAAYLAGYLAGTAAKKQKIDLAIADLGMQVPFHGGRLFAAIKGAIDAGLEVPVSEDALPVEDRLTGAHIDESLAKQVEDIKKKAGAQ